MHNANRRKIQALPLQLKYALYLTLTSGFLSLVTIFVMAWFIQRNYNLFMGDELGISAQVISIVRHEQKILELSLLFLFLFTTFAMFASTFYVIRRITGPIQALQRQLWLYSQGDWTREFRLRKGDDFKELERIVNDVRKAHFISPGELEKNAR